MVSKLYRTQYVCIDGHNSQCRNISVGVPQGSNLGPLLFLLYVNDLQYVSDVLSVLLFADDTSLYVSGKDLEHLNDVINVEMGKVQSWFIATCNRLQINYSKTCYIIFRPHHLDINEDLINIQLNGVVINQVKCTKFLGVFIDEKLSWNEHISYISLKISRIVGVLNNLKYILPLRMLVNI